MNMVYNLYVVIYTDMCSYSYRYMYNYQIIPFGLVRQHSITLQLLIFGCLYGN